MSTNSDQPNKLTIVVEMDGMDGAVDLYTSGPPMSGIQSMKAASMAMGAIFEMHKALCDAVGADAAPYRPALVEAGLEQFERFQDSDSDYESGVRTYDTNPNKDNEK